jgi:uncharacterized membrane protein
MDEFNQSLDSNISSQNNGSGLQVSPRISDYLLEMAKWTNFVAIAYMIFLGLICVLMLVAGSFVATLFGSRGGELGASAGLGILPILMVIPFLALAFYIMYTLYLAGKGIRQGIRENNQAALEGGIHKMRRFWKITGILFAIVLCFYAVAILAMLSMGALMGTQG